MVSGRARVRRGYTDVPSSVPVGWRLNDAEAALFEIWFKDDLLDGSAWFLMKLKTPIGIDLHRCRFDGVYDGPFLVGRAWRVSAVLELRRRPLLAEGSSSYPDAVLNSTIVDAAANREWPES